MRGITAEDDLPALEGPCASLVRPKWIGANKVIFQRPWARKQSLVFLRQLLKDLGLGNVCPHPERDSPWFVSRTGSGNDCPVFLVHDHISCRKPILQDPSCKDQDSRVLFRFIGGCEDWENTARKTW